MNPSPAPPTRPLCPYGKQCYRKNPAHLNEYRHDEDPVDDNDSRPECPPNLRPCPYGLNCTRKNKVHFREMKHPQAHPLYPFKRHPQPDSQPPPEVINSAQQRVWRERERAYRAALHDEPRLLPVLGEVVINYMKPAQFRYCYTPRTVDGKAPVTASKFGGTPYLKPGEPWPVCGGCGKKMILLVQIDLGTVPDTLIGAYGSANQMIQLFYCNNEYDCKAEKWEAWSKAHIARLVDKPGQLLDQPQPPSQPQSQPSSPASPSHSASVKKRKNNAGAVCPSSEPTDGPVSPVTEQHIVGWEEEEDDASYEDKEEMYGWSSEQVEEEEESGLADDSIVGGEKLSGFPLWIQSREYPDCPVCGKQMEFVFQIGDSVYCFGDAGFGYLTQCPDHKDQLAFNWQCT